MHKVIKRYGHEEGLSCCFRQWRAESHCRFIHGYALAFEFEFAAETLNENGWVIDFGSMKPLKQWLHDMFDHKLVVAVDDPKLSTFFELNDEGIADVLPLEKVGCEAFAKFAADTAQDILNYDGGRCWLVSVKVSEHAGNSAVYVVPYN